MKQIRLGLIDNLDVSIYAKINFDWKQMREIKYGLEDNLDISKYTKSEISWKEMNKTRKKLLKESTLK